MLAVNGCPYMQLVEAKAIAIVATFVAACFSLTGLLSGPRAMAETTPEATQEVLTGLATTSLLDHAQEYFALAVARQRKAKLINEATANQLLSFSKRMYSGVNLYPVFKRAYAKYSNQQDVTAVQSWLSSPFGVKYHQSINAALQASASTLTAYFDQHAEQVLRPNRKNALATFNKAWRHTELYQSFRLGMDFTVLLAAKQPGQDQESIAQLKERVSKTKFEFDRDAVEHFKAYDFYLCKEYKNEEIDELSKFAFALPTIGHLKAYIKALDSTLESAALTLQAQVVKANARGKKPDARP